MCGAPWTRSSPAVQAVETPIALASPGYCKGNALKACEEGRNPGLRSASQRTANYVSCSVSRLNPSYWSSRRRRCGALNVGQQRRLRAEHLGHGAPRADLVAPCRRIGRRAADPDGADHLVAVDDDRQAARIGEIA